MYRSILKSIDNSVEDTAFQGDLTIGDDCFIEDDCKIKGNLSVLGSTSLSNITFPNEITNGIAYINSNKELDTNSNLTFNNLSNTITSSNIVVNNDLVLNNLSSDSVALINADKKLTTDTGIMYNNSTDTLSVANLTVNSLGTGGNVVYTDVNKSLKSENAFSYNPVDNILTVDNVFQSGYSRANEVACNNFLNQVRTIGDNFINTYPTIVSGLASNLYHKLTTQGSPVSICGSIYSFFNTMHARVHCSTSGISFDMSNEVTNTPQSSNFITRMYHDFINNVWILPSSKLLVGTSTIQTEPFHVAGNNYTIARFRRQTLTPNVASNIGFENSNNQSALIGVDGTSPDLMLSPNSILRYRVNEHIIPMANNSQDLGSSSLRYRDIWGNNVVGLNTGKIYGNITTTASIATLNQGFGISSVTRTAQSQVQINFSSAFGNTNYTWIASSGFSSATAQSNFVSSPNMNNWKQTGSIRLQSYYGNMQTNIDITDLNVVIFGS